MVIGNRASLAMKQSELTDRLKKRLKLTELNDKVRVSLKAFGISMSQRLILSREREREGGREGETLIKATTVVIQTS